MYIEMMKDWLVKWGLISQVWDLNDSGIPLIDAITIVYKAHTRGNAYRASEYLAKTI